MKQKIKGLICFVIYYSGLFWVIHFFRKKVFRRGRFVILMYHRITVPEHDYSALCVSPDNFRRQIEYLSNRYNIVSLDKLVRLIKTGKRPDEDYIAITFDDGYKDNYINAYPILKEHNAPATIFLTTGYINNNTGFWWDRLERIVWLSRHKNISLHLSEEKYPKQICQTFDSVFNGKIVNVSVLSKSLKYIDEYTKNDILDDLEHQIPESLVSCNTVPTMLTWKEVRAMSQKEGLVSFGGHTVTHRIMTGLSLEQVREEVTVCKKVIKDHICKKVSHFAYPNGQATDFNDDIKNLLRTEGYVSSCSTVKGDNAPKEDLFSLKRLAIQDEPMFVFATIIEGILNKVP